MDHSKAIKTLMLWLYSAVTLSGCRCHDDFSAVPVPEEKSCYLYWPIDAHRQWVFEVYDNSISPAKYLFVDTLQFLRDSNILSHGELYFHVFGFKQSNQIGQFVIGNYIDNPGKLYLLMDNVNYTLFDVNLLTEKPPATTYKSNGLPIDNRYEMSYINLIGLTNTNIGKLRSLYSYYTFVQNYSPTGLESRDVTFIFGENTGPIQISYKSLLSGLN